MDRMDSVYGHDFGPFDGRIWFNCAHQGPLPRLAVAAAQRAIHEKVSPHLIADDDFTDLPKELKSSLAQLIGASAEDIILGNSASYGLHALRNGLSWRTGDEVLVVQGDFPATIYPWLGLEQFGVRVRLLTPRGSCLTARELAAKTTSSSRVLCVSWINSFNGSVLDLAAIGDLCRERGIIFALNASQGLGALPIDVEQQPIDALVSCGYKWLCGPYGTGFCWIKPELRNQLRPNQTYWLPQVWQKHDLTDYTWNEERDSVAFDVFCTANFLNFMPWRASVDYLLRIGVPAIRDHNRTLVEKLIGELNQDKFHLISPDTGASQSAIVVVSHVRRQSNSDVHTSLAKAGIDIALRAGNLRFSLHLYNSLDEITRAVAILNSID